MIHSSRMSVSPFAKTGPTEEVQVESVGHMLLQYYYFSNPIISVSAGLNHKRERRVTDANAKHFGLSFSPVLSILEIIGLSHTTFQLHKKSRSDGKPTAGREEKRR